MNPILRNIIAVIIGIVVGNIVNMTIVNLNWSVFPIEGFDPNNFDALIDLFPTLPPKYFIFPFLGHALGTLAGAFFVALIAANHKMKFAFAIGCLYLVGGITINIMITGPIWFTLLDIIAAYIPMAWLGGKLAMAISKK